MKSKQYWPHLELKFNKNWSEMVNWEICTLRNSLNVHIAGQCRSCELPEDAVEFADKFIKDNGLEVLFKPKCWTMVGGRPEVIND